MAKKLISVWLSMTIFIFSSISIYADENIQGKFFLKNIVVNGENIVNYQLDNPLLFHNDYIYIPMDHEMGKILGFEATMDWESRTLKILRVEPTQKNVSEPWVKNNMDDVTVKPYRDIKAVTYVETQKKDANRLQDKQANAPETNQAVISDSLLKRGDLSDFEDNIFQEGELGKAEELFSDTDITDVFADVTGGSMADAVLVRNRTDVIETDSATPELKYVEGHSASINNGDRKDSEAGLLIRKIAELVTTEVFAETTEEKLSDDRKAIDDPLTLYKGIMGMSLSGQATMSGAAESEMVTTAELNLKGQPVLVKDNIVYIPLATIVSSSNFGWSSHYDAYSGVSISTDKSIDAVSYYNEPFSRYTKGLAAYIRYCNNRISEKDALEMVLYFRNYGQIYGVDPTLLMAIAQKESTYKKDEVSSSNCVGLMQIMVSTGKGYGFSKSQLFQVKPNIQMGTIYISEVLKSFNGDSTKALSAYNQGAGAVKKGNYSTAYAKRVLKAQQSLNDFLSSHGYR